MRGLSLVAASGGHSSSRCAGLSLSQPLLLWSTGSRRAGSVIVAHGPSCSMAMWDLPRPGLEPVSPALAGRFSTTAPPGKPQKCELLRQATPPKESEDIPFPTKGVYLFIFKINKFVYLFIFDCVESSLLNAGFL